MFPLPNVSTATGAGAATPTWGPNGIDFPGYFSGQRFNSVANGAISTGLISGYSAFTVATDTFTLCPFFILKDTTIDRIGVYEAAGTGAQDHKLGLYTAARQLIESIGTVTATGSAGIIEVAYTKTLPKGLYFLGVKSSAAQTFGGHILNSTLTSGSVALGKSLYRDLASIGTPTSAATISDSFWQGAHTYASAFPAVVPSLTASTSDDSTPTVFLRAA